MPGDGEEVMTLVLDLILLAQPVMAPVHMDHLAQALVKGLQASRFPLAATSKRLNAL